MKHLTRSEFTDFSAFNGVAKDAKSRNESQAMYAKIFPGVMA